MSRRTVMILVGVSIAALLLFGWLWFVRKSAPVADDMLLSALASVPGTDSYTQTAATETEIAGRNLKVEGIYHVDRKNGRFASSATTTLTIPDNDERQIFNLMNISIGEDVFVKIETTDEDLQARIPHSPEWKHFSRMTVPVAFADIAVSGPILDNLLLFSENGAYLRLTENHGKEKWGEEELLRYAFVVADDAPKEAGGTLQTLLDRIGDGTVDIWIDGDGTGIRHMVVASGQYHSTTTFSNANHIPGIESPVRAKD
jgi:hypothetical protein